MKSGVLRTVGGMLGLLLVAFGAHLLVHPLFKTNLEKIDSIASIILGCIFLAYAIRRGKRKS